MICLFPHVHCHEIFYDVHDMRKILFMCTIHCSENASSAFVAIETQVPFGCDVARLTDSEYLNKIIQLSHQYIKYRLVLTINIFYLSLSYVREAIRMKLN